MVESGALTLGDAAATRAHGARLAAALLAVRPERLIVFLEGDLGAGKTTLAQGFLAALGHRGRVPSPTYTLIEPYDLSGYRVYHIDLYRIRQPRELEDLDLPGQLTLGAVALVEWPDHGTGQLAEPDLWLRFEWSPAGRLLTCRALSERGQDILAHLPA